MYRLRLESGSVQILVLLPEIGLTPSLYIAMSISPSPQINFRPLNSCSDTECEQAVKHPSHKRSYCTEDYVEHALAIDSIEGLHAFAAKVMRDFGYSIFGGGAAILDEAGPTMQFMCSGNVEWISHYRENLITQDPLILYCKDNLVPNVWKASKDIDHLRMVSPNMAGAIDDFGIRSFVTFPAHGPQSLISGFRFAYDEDDKLSEQDIAQSLPILSLLNGYLYEALVRILKLENQKDVSLTTKERDILSWVAGGLNSYNISERLNISENTVLYHMKNIHKKLEVKTRQHAVAKALKLNLIEV